MLFTTGEIFDILLMTFAIGFIFSDLFSRFNQRIKSEADEILSMYTKKKLFNWEDIKLAAILVAPAIILHELGHKFMAMAFGAVATFQAAYTFLILGIILKLMNFGFIFIVPAYVSWMGNVTHFQAALIAFAGPLVNLVIWLICKMIVKYKLVNRKYIPMVMISSKINIFLFIFNMIPIPFFDGGHVVKNLFYLIA